MIYLLIGYLVPSRLVHFRHWVMMQQLENSINNEDCLKVQYTGTNVATQIALERNILWFLQKCQFFKRVPQSLRVSGMNALPDEKGKLLIQEFETKALQCAIEEKNILILKLEEKRQLQNVADDVDWRFVASKKKKTCQKACLF